MTTACLISALLLFFSSPSNATELGRSGSTTPSVYHTTSDGYLPVTARERIPTPTPGQPCRSNFGLCTLIALKNALTGAQARARREEGLRNIARTTQDRTTNIKLDGWSFLRKGTASCYGTPKDGFAGGPTMIGPMDPRKAGAACAPELAGKIVVIRDPKTKIAHSVTCVSTGAFKSKYGRMIDLFASVFKDFGKSCDRDGLMKNVELYVRTKS